MGWVDNRTVFLKIEDNKKYRLRVLLPFICRSCQTADYYPNYPNVKCFKCDASANMLTEAECLSGWYHKVAGVFNTDKKLKRGYRTFLCNLDGSGRGAECKAGLCGKLDPLYAILGERDKFRKKNNVLVETHFGLTPQHIIPVYNYETQQLQILKFGNELRKGLARIIEAKNVLAGRDILVWRNKTENQTNYFVEAGDPSPFQYDGTLDYSGIDFKKILSFEEVDKTEVWDYVQGGPLDATPGGALPQGKSAPAITSGSVGFSQEDIDRYKRVRGLRVDIGNRYMDKTVGSIIDQNDFGYFAWLAGMSPSLKDDAKWLADLFSAKRLQDLIRAATTAHEPPTQQEPPPPTQQEPPPPEPQPSTTDSPTQYTITPHIGSTDVKTTYVNTPVAEPDAATLALVTTANDMIEKKFAGKPDEDIVNHLANIYGKYGSIVELDISKWPKEKLTNLIASLVS